MQSKTTAGLESLARPAESTENERVTARIVREDDGTTHHQYSIGGRVYGSLTELRVALGDQR